jgi:hypothetical protein
MNKFLKDNNMAAIEKICEFSGDYPEDSYMMYQWKRNGIQVMPEYRKHFRGADAVLHIIDKEQIAFNVFGGYSRYKGTKEDFLDDKYFRPYLHKRLGYSYDYYLEIKNPELKGRVDGEYHNTTKDLTATKRKLKRLLRCRTLKIIVHT